MSGQLSLKNKNTFRLGFIALTLVSASVHSAWREGLNETEIQSLELSVVEQSRNQNLTDELILDDSQLGLEVLLIELQEIKTATEDDPRLAEVFVFDYATSTASVRLIEVESQAVLSSRQITDIHLPLNEREVVKAKQWLFNDPALKSALESEYQKQLGEPLVSMKQLDMKVSIWNPGPGRAKSHECQLTRCALVSIFTTSYHNFSIEPIVNLATGTVNLDWVQ